MAVHTEQWIEISDKKAAGMLQKLHASLNPRAKFTGEKVWKVEGFPGDSVLFFQKSWLDLVFNTIENLPDEKLAEFLNDSDFVSMSEELQLKKYLCGVLRVLLFPKVVTSVQ